MERYNLANPSFHEAAFGGCLMLQYIDNADEGEPLPWSTRDLVILATTEAKACTVIVGGAPKPVLMQAVCGTQGARPYSSNVLDESFHWVSDKNETTASRLPAVRERGMFINYAAFNSRDQLRENDTETPLHFRFVATDCRVYYTLDNVYNRTVLWRDAARAAFEDESLCVEGWTGYTSRNSTTPKPPLKAPGIRAPALGIATTYAVNPDPYAQNRLPAAQGQIGKQVVLTLCNPKDGNSEQRC